MDAAAWGLVGTLVGAAASIGTSWIANTFSFRMHSDKQQEERREKAKEFQRTTLLDLQEALHDAVRMHARAHHEYYMAFKTGAHWGRFRLSGEVDKGNQISARKVSILIERVENEKVRREVKNLTAMLAMQPLIEDRDVAEGQQFEIADLFLQLQKDLGTVLRSYY
jgi:hypothetical protein